MGLDCILDTSETQRLWPPYDIARSCTAVVMRIHRNAGGGHQKSGGDPVHT